MPELPEVRTVIKNISPFALNKTIKNTKIFWNKLLLHPSIDEYTQKLQGLKISDISSYGKWIQIYLENNYVLVSHLRMTGMWYVEKQDDPFYNENHLRAVINFTDNYRLSYYDSRGIGTLELFSSDEFNNKGPKTRMGPEPWSENYEFEVIAPKIKKSRKAIKTIILDQAIIAGIGNIYANEILFACKINPETPGNKINDDQIIDIMLKTKEILEKAIASGGTTVHDFAPEVGKTGGYQNYLQVHLRKNKPCYVCGTSIVKNFVNGRGTYFCPNCQPNI